MPGRSQTGITEAMITLIPSLAASSAMAARLCSVDSRGTGPMLPPMSLVPPPSVMESPVKTTLFARDEGGNLAEFAGEGVYAKSPAG